MYTIGSEVLLCWQLVPRVSKLPVSEHAQTLHPLDMVIGVVSNQIDTGGNRLITFRSNPTLEFENTSLPVRNAASGRFSNLASDGRAWG